MAAENGAFIDNQLAGGEIAFVSGGLFELDAIGGGEIAADIALDNDAGRLDIRLHLGFPRDVQSAAGVDFAFEPPHEPEPFFEGDFSLESCIRADDGWKFGVASFRHSGSSPASFDLSPAPADIVLREYIKEWMKNIKREP
jgi:hypothetical protein